MDASLMNLDTTYVWDYFENGYYAKKTQKIPVESFFDIRVQKSTLETHKLCWPR